MTITLEDYWMGRDALFPKDLTDEVRANAERTVRRVNALLERFYAAHQNAVRRKVNSGWRPLAVNKRTANAALGSRHIMALAVDLSDDDEMLDKWCASVDGRIAMTETELWLEHPIATPRWCHLQTVPPKSKNRIFMP